MALPAPRAIPILLTFMLVSHVAATRASTPCPPGRFLVTSPVPPPAAEPVEVVAFDAAGTLTIDGCGPTAATVRAGRSWTRLHARWEPCGQHRRLRLRARIHAPECTTLEGWLRGTGYPATEFSAVRSTCGDGVLDVAGGEQCDASAVGGDVPCPGSCGEPSSATPCRCTSIETAPSRLAAAIVGGDVVLTWTPPDPASGLTDVRLVRRLNQPPADADDPQATLVFVGSAAEAVDPVAGLLPDTAETSRTYHYAVFGCLPGGSCETTGSRASLIPSLVQVLAAGGYVLHWRHATATVCADNLALGTAATTMVPDWWQSCEADCAIATARQLSDVGRNEATAIGAELRARGVPFGRVVTSEFCRNVETADLMALGPVPEESPAITYFVHDEANRCADSYALLAEAPASGTNTALIGHAGFSPACPVLGELAWGEAAVFKPDGIGGTEFVTRVLWDGWSALP
jgi:phosphohistidine phosphatase SixA